MMSAEPVGSITRSPWLGWPLLLLSTLLAIAPAYYGSLYLGPVAGLVIAPAAELVLVELLWRERFRARMVWDPDGIHVRKSFSSHLVRWESVTGVARSFNEISISTVAGPVRWEADLPWMFGVGYRERAGRLDEEVARLVSAVQSYKSGPAGPAAAGATGRVGPRRPVLAYIALPVVSLIGVLGVTSMP